MISEIQGLEKLRSVSNLRKISGHAHLDFFQVYGIIFFLGGDLEKYPGFGGPEIFLRFEADLDFQKSMCRLKGRKSISRFFTIKPCCILRRGLAVIFTSGEENLHRVTPVMWGMRRALTIFLTCDKALSITNSFL